MTALDAITVALSTALGAVIMLRAMPRWEPDGVDRLQAAALELFAEQGFERTTVAEITQRAGLTKRTFFNHFADKREVLFGPVAGAQQEILTREIVACPAALPPLEAVVCGLQAAGDTLWEARRAAVIRRREIIDANPELQERELRKRATLTGAIAGALRARGTDPDTALLSAHIGVLVQQTAMQRWAQSAGNRPLRDFLSDALLSLRTIAAQTTDERVVPADT
jgi:AcrR family transcriptional regulator